MSIWTVPRHRPLGVMHFLGAEPPGVNPFLSGFRTRRTGPPYRAKPLGPHPHMTSKQGIGESARHVQQTSGRDHEPADQPSLPRGPVLQPGEVDTVGPVDIEPRRITFELPDGDDDLTDHAVPGGRASGPAAPRRRPSRTPPAPRPHRPVHARYTTKCPTGRWAASWVVVLPPTDHWTRSGPVVLSSDFWNRPLQNWRSEFLAVGSMVVLSITCGNADHRKPNPSEPPTPPPASKAEHTRANRAAHRVPQPCTAGRSQPDGCRRDPVRNVTGTPGVRNNTDRASLSR